MSYRRFSICCWSQSLISCLWASVKPGGSGNNAGLITSSYVKPAPNTATTNRNIFSRSLSQPKTRPSQSFSRSEKGTVRSVAQREPANV